MNKVLTQGLLLICLFAIVWFGFSQIDWMSHLKIEQATSKTEEKLGEIFWKLFKNAEHESTDPKVIASVDSIVSKICTANQINRASIKIHVLNKADINAFALPAGHLIVFSGLITNAKNPEELSGVLAHEIAHIQLKHVMNKLVSEVGLSMLISISAGNVGSEIVKKALKVLSSTAFDRGLEKEADLKAVDYLIAAQINPEPFAEFLYTLSIKEPDSFRHFTWISTHPDSKERSEYIMDHIKGTKIQSQSILSDSTWSELQSRLED